MPCVTAVAGVAVVARVHSLAWEHPNAVSVVKIFF